MLTAIDLDFLAGDVARRFRTKKENHIGDLVRRSNAPHGNNGSKPRFAVGRQDIGSDLAGRNGIDPDSVRRKIVRHFARETGERRFRGRVGRSGEGMNTHADDRGEIHHGATTPFEFIE